MWKKTVGVAKGPAVEVGDSFKSPDGRSGTRETTDCKIPAKDGE